MKRAELIEAAARVLIETWRAGTGPTQEDFVALEDALALSEGPAAGAGDTTS